MEINIALFRAHGSVSILGYTMMKKKDYFATFVQTSISKVTASAKNTEQAFISMAFELEESTPKIQGSSNFGMP